MAAPLRSTILGAFVALLLLTAPGAASAASAPDAGCPGPSDQTPLAPLGDRREAQTFAAIRTGALDRVTLVVNNLSPSDPDFLVQILPTDSNGLPVNGALASTGVPRASVPAGVSTFDISFQQPAVVTAGHVYAVVISRPGANFLLPTWQIATRKPDACQGQSFYSYGADLGWMPEPTPADIIFQTYVNPIQITGQGGSANFTLVRKHGRLFANVPAPGRLIVDDAKKGKGPGSLKRTKARARRAGLVPLRVELTDKAVRRALKRRKLNVLAGVTYRPTGGQPSSLEFRIKLRF